jgi:hypothetical protein
MKYILILIFCLIGFVIFYVYKEIQDQKLLRTATKVNRGTKSEQKMVLKLLKNGVKPKAIFHDLYLYIGNGNYCQIDLIVATKVGMIVFEIKEYNGWILGNEKQQKWTQILAYGKEKYHFYNPIHQNKKHIEDLKTFPQFENIPFFSVIVFFGSCELKSFYNLPERTFLSKSSLIIEIFNEILQNNEIINYKSKWDIFNLLDKAKKNGDDSKIIKQHKEYINKLKLRYKYFN